MDTIEKIRHELANIAMDFHAIENILVSEKIDSQRKIGLIKTFANQFQNGIETIEFELKRLEGKSSK